MLNKRPSLAESMRAVAEPPTPLPAIPAPKPVAAPAPEAEQPTPKKGFYAATRAGKKKATASLSTEAHRQLKLLAVDHGRVEALLTEAINDLFRKYGKEPIA